MEQEREASIASSVDFYEPDTKLDTSADSAQNGVSAAKRKAEELENVQDKKRKIYSPPAVSISPDLKPCAGLPPAVWQHVFLSCSLATLGRLLQVNQSFYSYLTSVRSVPNINPESGFLRLIKSDSIWAAARNAAPKKPPKPLPGFSELQMWQLVFSKKCQFCGKQSSFTPGEKVWQQGPGADGVRTVWPFAIRSCGSCLVERCQTDSSLLFSTASALRPALPYALITNDKHYIPAYTLQSATTPAGVEIVKYYYKAHVKEISEELENAQSLGQAAAEEWSKGLDARGRERMKAAENWERWEVKYQWWLDHEQPNRALSLAPSTASSLRQHTQSPARTAHSPVLHAPTPSTPVPQYGHHRPSTIPPQGYTPQPTPGGRNLHDANEAKANRKADIERRCQQLDPPIPPNVLRHMDSFKAAIQISQPMTDYAWSVLQPRLQLQLPAAQRAEADHMSRVSSLATRTADRRLQDVNLKEVKEVLDREWEEAQRPTRERLSAIADDFINRDWNHGRAVTYENSPKFAVDLLMYVRRTFYEESAKGETTSQHPQPDFGGESESRPPKLVLENMKWVYDNKLKPLTEQFRKELFLCHGNGCEGNARFYGFEGVIQHFGAKHTNAFSVGNVVVAWREAEWPEETPFHPDPISVRHVQYSASGMAGQGQSTYGSYHGGYSRAATSTPHVQSHFAQASPGPYHQYGAHYNGPFDPPQALTTSIAGYDYTQSYPAAGDPYTSYPTMVPPGYGPQASSDSYTTSPVMSSSADALPQSAQTEDQSMSNLALQNYPEDVQHRTTNYDKQVSTVIQMAQDIWKQTSGVKDLPSSLRIYVLLQRVIFKFQLEFNHEPNLNHFFDAFSSHQIPKALKNAPGLSCKACQHRFLQFPAFPHNPEDRRTYTVLNLISHFKSIHSGPRTPGYGSSQFPTTLDWKEDMIELPSDRLISGLIHAPGMDDDKLHIIATVFPRLFPTPLPKIGNVDSHGVASPAPKDSKAMTGAGESLHIVPAKSGPSSLSGSYADSPKPPSLRDDEYDPLRPALVPQVDQGARISQRRRVHHASPPPGHGRLHSYAEPRYYLPQDNGLAGPRDYLELTSGSQNSHDPDALYEEVHGGRALYQGRGRYDRPSDMARASYQEGYHGQDYLAHPRQGRHVDSDTQQTDYRVVMDPEARIISPSGARAEADRFLEGLLPYHPSAARCPSPEMPSASRPKPAEADIEDGSRYTPPPPDVAFAADQQATNRLLAATEHAAPSTVSNGSRYEEYHPDGRQIPTPDSGAATRRNGSHRRRDRFNENVPSRYYRYMSIARDDAYPRGASINRSQSRRYERYEEQRRRLDQQETPQPHLEREHDPLSRDQSVDIGLPDDRYYRQVRRGPPEGGYISTQEGIQTYPSARHRYSGPPDDSRGPPLYVDEYGRPVEVIHVPRDYSRPARGPYYAHSPPQYAADHEPEHIRYVPVPYDRRPPQRYEDRPSSYVYYEGRERSPLRRPAQPAGYEAESEAPYEPPDIKIEHHAPVNASEGP